METKEDGTDIGSKFCTLFDVLNTPGEKRPKELEDEFKIFPYVNGGIFAEKISEIKFNKKMRVALVEVANYDWTTINPTIFGSLFQLIKDKETRRELGEHYTSEENINKIVYPLFLDELQERLATAWDSKKELKKLRQDLTKIKVFDPACGCGNFLVVSYRHLRQLELELIVRLSDLEGTQDLMQLDGSMGISITLNQLYGIEIEEWPAQVARMALFLTDHQENLRLERITGTTPNRFPIKEFSKIVNDQIRKVRTSLIRPKDVFFMSFDKWNQTRLDAFVKVNKTVDSLFGWNKIRFGNTLR
jgi:type I restriction-modification system DNA methylase subunit